MNFKLFIVNNLRYFMEKMNIHKMLPTNPRTKKKESSWQGESELLCLAETLILLHPL